MKRKGGEEWARSHPTPESIFHDMKAERVKRKVRKHAPLNRTPRLILAISDVHRPRFDPATWSIFLQAVRDMKPDAVWIVGDYVDLSSVNRHERAPGDAYTLKMELWDANRGLDELSEAIGPRACSLTYIDGNHEDRLRRYIASGRCPPEMRDMIDDIPNELMLRERGWRYVHPDQQPIYPFPGFALFHGHRYGVSHAREHALMMATSGCYGHTHRSQTHITYNSRGPVVMVGMPCARDPKAEWQHQRRQEFTGWSVGFAVVEVVDDEPHVRVVLTHRARAVYAGHVWRAK